MPDPVSLFAFLRSNPNTTRKLLATDDGELLVLANGGSPYPSNAVRFPAIPPQPPPLASAFICFPTPVLLLAFTVSWVTGAPGNAFIQLHNTAGPLSNATRMQTIIQLAPGSGAYAYSEAQYQCSTALTIAASTVQNGYTAAGAFLELIEAWGVPL